MAAIEPTRYNDLKARVKAECQRRAHVGSVKTYSGTAYDYTTAPEKGVQIANEHLNKLETPLNAINSSTVTVSPNGSRVTDAQMTTMEAFVTLLEKRTKTDTSGTDCSNSCTGLCYGCTGNCTGECSFDCSDVCTGCGGTCEDTCIGKCTDKCTGTCWAGCADSCEIDCSDVCWNGCKLGCTGVNTGTVQ